MYIELHAAIEIGYHGIWCFSNWITMRYPKWALSELASCTATSDKVAIDYPNRCGY